MILIDVAARVIDVNDSYVEMSRRDRKELIGAFTSDFIHAEDLAGTLIGLDTLEAGARSARQRRRHLRGDGTWVEVEALTSWITLEDERVLLVQILEVGDTADVEVDTEARARLLIQPYGDAACFHDDDGRIVFAAANLAELLERPGEWLHGRRLTDPELQTVDIEGFPLPDEEDPVLRALRIGHDVTSIIGLLSASHERVWFSVRAGPVGSPNLPVRSTLRDISELVRAQEETRLLAAIVERELTHRADHDSLTGLKARHVITEAIENPLLDGSRVSVVFVDLDGFKQVNDRHGHLAGDEVLVAVADRLQELVPSGATLGRKGGDEFVAVFHEAAAAESFATTVADQELTTPPLPALSASVGVAHSRPDDTPRRLLQRADDAMYAAKRRSQRQRA